jgi:hypothetical protein
MDVSLEDIKRSSLKRSRREKPEQQAHRPLAPIVAGRPRQVNGPLPAVPLPAVPQELR